MKKLLAMLIIMSLLICAFSSCSTGSSQTNIEDTTPQKAVDTLNQKEYLVYKAVTDYFLNPSEVKVVGVKSPSSSSWSGYMVIAIEGKNALGGTVTNYYFTNGYSLEKTNSSAYSDGLDNIYATVHIRDINAAIKEYCIDKGLSD